MPLPSGFVRTIPYGHVRMRGVTAKRRVAQFGWRHAFEAFQLTPAVPVPAELENIRQRAAALAGVAALDFSEALVTEYRPGAFRTLRR